MKNMKKIIAVLMSVSAIAMSTSAFAATDMSEGSTAIYDAEAGSVALTTTSLDSVADGEQLTVVIVPTTLGTTTPTSGNIYYINQDEAGTAFDAIIAAMKVKDGFDFENTEYEVRIGGALTDDYYVCTVTGEELEEIIYGDVNDDGSVKANDVVFLKRHLAKWTGYAEADINYAGADTNDDGSVKANDVVFLKRYLAKWTGYETLPYKN